MTLRKAGIAALLVVALGLGPIHIVVSAQAPSPDAALLERLTKSGSNLSKLHRVDFLLRFPTQEAAVNAESQLQILAFATMADTAEDDTGWVVIASKKMYPTESDLAGLRDKLNTVAKENGGAYEGWQAVAIE